MKYAYLIFFILLLFTTACDDGLTTTELPSNLPTGDQEQGRLLFNDPQLTNAENTFYSCAVCHSTPDDTTDYIHPAHSLVNVRNRGMWWVGVDTTEVVLSLREAVNVCLTNWMQSPPLMPDDEKWQHLDTYLASISTGSGGLVINIIDPDSSVFENEGVVENGSLRYEEYCQFCHGEVLTSEGRQIEYALSMNDWLDLSILDVVRSSGLPLEFDVETPLSQQMPFIAGDILPNENVIDLQAYLDDQLENLLFDNIALGDTSETSHQYTCLTCHDFTPFGEEPDLIRAGGSLHNVSAQENWWQWNQWAYDQSTIEGAVDLCITKWMEGEALDPEDIPNYETYAAYFSLKETSDRQPPAPTPSETILDNFSFPEPDSASGRQIYERSCIICHGSVEGDDIAPLPNVPSIFDETHVIYDDFAEWVRRSGTGVSGDPEINAAKMPFYGDEILSDDDLRDVIYYIIFYVNNGPPPPR